MNLHHLAVFHAVAQNASVSLASRQMHISQPAISRELKQLETRLGVPLFERLPRGMRLTEAGALLYDYATRIFALERSAESAVQDYLGVGVGSLEIGASQTIGNYLLPDLLAQFRQAYPRIRLALEIDNTETVARGVESYRYALGFVEGLPPVGGFVVETLRQDRIVPIIATGHPLALKPPASARALAALPALLREVGSGSRQVIEAAFARRKLVLISAGEVGSSEALLRAAIAGAGLVWMSELSAQDALARRDVVQLPTHGLRIERSLSLIRIKDRHLSPAAAAFIDLCRGRPRGNQLPVGAVTTGRATAGRSKNA